MKERPILFNGAMVRALLDGSKTQTRRVVKPRDLAWMDEHQGLREPDNAIRCPHGQPGDRLWVREAHYLTDNGDEEYAVYATDSDAVRGHLTSIDRLPSDFPAEVKAQHRKLRPSIHMPRWASRITLEIVSVRVERLQGISEADAIAEGIEPFTDFLTSGHWRRYDKTTFSSYVSSPVDSYASLWEQINGPSRWDSSPWVWVVEFKRIE